ncbi:MAG: Asp-tRNA(Asn)/Glu-tRNA(Gln) amidotransferase GatCAB subunit C [Candidatus Pacebacteria bacterium CG10_big_fil_rev_8_21_14_0_10_56_10]|nr:MAG: Asp-tRNA(Asn)/Glu-tRNA(Gln) amidotransferase GatCAB subunit C [Candidatus Pacebacteria bacterium CG10_big_fil_rev_8_21_14_0_10_56_10]
MSTPRPRISPQSIHKIAQLAKLSVSDAESDQLAAAFGETLEVIDHLRQADVADIPPTHQVTGLENVWRDDVVNDEQSLSQSAALANAAHTHQGYFVVPAILNHKTRQDQPDNEPSP